MSLTNTKVEQLVTLGFDRLDVERALLLCNNNKEQAIEMLLRSPQTPHLKSLKKDRTILSSINSSESNFDLNGKKINGNINGTSNGNINSNNIGDIPWDLSRIFEENNRLNDNNVSDNPNGIQYSNDDDVIDLGKHISNNDNNNAHTIDNIQNIDDIEPELFRRASSVPTNHINSNDILFQKLPPMPDVIPKVRASSNHIKSKTVNSFTSNDSMTHVNALIYPNNNDINIKQQKSKKVLKNRSSQKKPKKYVIIYPKCPYIIILKTIITYIIIGTYIIIIIQKKG